MSELHFFVEGTPVAKQSFRKTKTGGYIDPRVKAWQDTVSWKAKEAVDGDPLTGTIEAELKFYLPTKRVVDLDNLSKAVLDGLKNIAFGDDSDVIRLMLTKEVSKPCGVSIDLFECRK